MMEVRKRRKWEREQRSGFDSIVVPFKSTTANDEKHAALDNLPSFTPMPSPKTSTFKPFTFGWSFSSTNVDMSNTNPEPKQDKTWANFFGIKPRLVRDAADRDQAAPKQTAMGVTLSWWSRITSVFKKSESRDTHDAYAPPRIVIDSASGRSDMSQIDSVNIDRSSSPAARGTTWLNAVPPNGKTPLQPATVELPVRPILILGKISYVFFIASFLLLSLFARRAGYLDAKVWAIVVIQLAFQLTNTVDLVPVVVSSVDRLGIPAAWSRNHCQFEILMDLSENAECLLFHEKRPQSCHRLYIPLAWQDLTSIGMLGPAPGERFRRGKSSKNVR